MDSNNNKGVSLENEIQSEAYQWYLLSQQFPWFLDSLANSWGIFQTMEPEQYADSLKKEATVTAIDPIALALRQGKRQAFNEIRGWVKLGEQFNSRERK